MLCARTPKMLGVLLVTVSIIATAFGDLVEQPLRLQPEAQRARDGYAPEHTSGYFKLNRTHDAHMFYTFFESRSGGSDDPLVLWMTGGPGCSSELAIFYENGPYHIKKDLTLETNEYGWDKYANMLFVDQPIGTGFSYTTDDRDMVSDEHGVAADMLNFLQEFLDARPTLRPREFFVTGESYGGHYVPAVSHKIYTHNKLDQGPKINLRGLAIGNGLTDPAIQYGAYADFALENGLVSQSTRDNIKRFLPVCTFGINACNNWPILGPFVCPLALQFCQTTQFASILAAAGNVNVYDIRKECVGVLCYDFSRLDDYLNQPAVRAELNIPADVAFQECNFEVNAAFQGDWPKRFDQDITPMLDDGIRTLIYAGVEDLICNWLGNKRWVDVLPWTGVHGWKNAPEKAWAVDSKTVGSVRSYGGLSFVKVAEAGHMVPMDQPKAALVMITGFLAGKDFETQPAGSVLVSAASVNQTTA